MKYMQGIKLSLVGYTLNKIVVANYKKITTFTLPKGKTKRQREDDLEKSRWVLYTQV